MLLMLYPPENWQSLPPLSANVKTLLGIGRSMWILIRVAGCARFWRKCARIFAPAGLTICRDRQDSFRLCTFSFLRSKKFYNVYLDDDLRSELRSWPKLERTGG
jgi:hypothetical protein